MGDDSVRPVIPRFPCQPQAEMLHSIVKMTHLVLALLSFTATNPGEARLQRTWLLGLLVISQTGFCILKINSPWSHDILSWKHVSLPVGPGPCTGKRQHHGGAGRGGGRTSQNGACPVDADPGEGQGILNGGVEMISAPILRRKKNQADPRSTKQLLLFITEVHLNAAVTERGVSIETGDPGDQDAVSGTVADPDFSWRGGNCCVKNKDTPQTQL